MTAIRVPEAVNSVVVGDPALFQVEHSEHEPELVFVKALTNEPAESNLLISTARGRQIRVFGSFNLHDEFFAKHQLNYLADIVRVLVHTGQKFNFYDVLVMAIDEQVLREQVEKARQRLEHDTSIPVQRRLNFEMSVKNLYQSFADRERVPKIQGLVNECMTFLDDELSVITGPYEELLSLDEVIEQELILFVTLNVNKNTEPVRALGKMLLQNLQLVVGKRYESEEQRRRSQPADVQRRAGRVCALRIPQLRTDPADRPRHPHGVSVLNAKPAATHAGWPGL